MKNMPVGTVAFNVPVFCVYIYSCRKVLEVHRYFSVCVEQMPSLFCELFFSVRHTASLVIKHFSFYDTNTVSLVIKKLKLLITEERIVCDIVLWFC